MTTPTHPDDYASTRHDTGFLGGGSGPAHHVPFERVPPLADMPAADGDSPFESVGHPPELADGEPTSHDAAHADHHMDHHMDHHGEAQTELYTDQDAAQQSHRYAGQHTAHSLEYERADDEGGHGESQHGESHDDADRHDEARHQDARGDVHEHAADQGGSHAGNGFAAPEHAIARATAGRVTTPAAPETVSAAADARGMLEGVAQTLRTLAGREGADGASIAIFPRGVDLLEVRMHISRDRDIDLNFRVAGPTPPGSSI